MSLHIGNLSSNIHKDDLHRVFRRFGTCTIQVKDKYGFVVYDYPASAEKALKTLRGTMVCGRAITLSWSNRQPRAMQRFSRGGKLYEPSQRGYSVKENADRRLHSHGRRAVEMDVKKADGEIRIGSSDLVDDSKHYVGEASHTSLTDCHGIEGSIKILLEDERWSEQVVDPSNESEKVLNFDRYEPNQSDAQKELDEHQGAFPLDGSPSIRKTQERTGNTYSGKLEKSCYLCGDVSHKMSKCPLQLKRHVPRRGLHPSDDTFPLRYQESDRDTSTSKHQRDSPTLQSTPRGRRKEFRDSKRNRRDYQSQDKNHLEGARGPPPSSVYSDYTSSRSKSPSRSVRTLSQLPSLSQEKSAPLEKISLSSSLEPSPSSHSGSETSKLQSTLRSMSPTSALSPVEVNANVSPSPNKRLKDSKGSVGNVVDLAHSMNLFEEETHATSDKGASRAENIISSVENESQTKPAELEKGDFMKDLSEKDNEHCQSAASDSHELLESDVPLSDGDDQVVDNLIPKIERETRDSHDEERVLALESDNSVRSNASDPLRMSSEEVCTILKHYGLQHPEENEKDLPVNIYFGSARLWPWEIVYYRRLKKGPLSTENYSRRIAQNEEFGIVDKYIRSSSGWAELDENNP